MEIAENQLHALLARINGGQAAAALPDVEAWLAACPGHPGLLALKAEACRLSGQHAAAIAAYQAAGAQGAGARNWLAAGILLAGERRSAEAVDCLQRALAEAPESDEVLDALITTLFNAGRQAAGDDYARRQLRLSRNPRFLSNAALLLQGNEHYEEASAAFREIIALAGDDPALLGAALVPARYTCDWDWIATLQRKILDCYARGEHAAPQEYPLTHLTWCADEACNFAVTRAYARRVAPPVPPLALQTPPAAGRRLRVGYLSSDFRNHATMHLMVGLFEQHDRSRFEIFAYDYSTPDVSDYRQRFLAAVEHHVDLTALSDAQAAARIAADGLDLLFELKGHTGGSRPGITAWRPAPLQVAYLGFPGSAASPDVDYLIGDRQVTPESSRPHYSEAFCRLPHSYQCNDRLRPIAADPGSRAAHGLPEAAVVFGAFNQSYKIDRDSFETWLRILAGAPNSVLWLLGQSSAARANLSRHAVAAGIAAERLIFAPFAPPREHLARLQLADAVLDTLVCNGHTTTSDALWAGVPVLTARGRHFASRVSESLLLAMDLPELVGADRADLVEQGIRFASDADYRRDLRAKVAAQRLSAPLFDSRRFTRNFERAIEMMVERQRAGLPPASLDVPDVASAPTAALPPVAPPPALQQAFAGCPLCGGASRPLRSDDCTRHPLWHPPLPRQIDWLSCPDCGHVHSRHYWTAAGLAEVFRHANPGQIAGQAGAPDLRRTLWAPVVDRALAGLGGYPVLRGTEPPRWLDIGCGDGGLLMTAADYGFAASGLDARQESAARLNALGYPVALGDFMTHEIPPGLAVLSLMDVVEHLPDPRACLERAAGLLRPGGLLVVSLPDRSSSAWRQMEAAGLNPYWMELEHHHNFSREQMLQLIEAAGCTPIDCALPQRYKAQIELYARRR